MSAEIFNSAQITFLRAPLNSKCIKSRSQGGTEVQYIEGWHAIAEANRIFGFGAWDHEIIELTETNRDLVKIERKNSNPPMVDDQWRIGFLCRVRVHVHGEDGQRRFRDGVGYGSGMSKDNALGEAIESAVKEAETDALKRALVKFGNPFGLALYDKAKRNVGAPDDDERGSANDGVERQPKKHAPEPQRQAPKLQVVEPEPERQEIDPQDQENYNAYVARMQKCNTPEELAAFDTGWGRRVLDNLKQYCPPLHARAMEVNSRYAATLRRPVNGEAAANGAHQ